MHRRNTTVVGVRDVTAMRHEVWLRVSQLLVSRGNPWRAQRRASVTYVRPAEVPRWLRAERAVGAATDSIVVGRVRLNRKFSLPERARAVDGKDGRSDAKDDASVSRG